MTLEQATEILARVDPNSRDQFTADERAAITTVGAAYLMHEITRQQAAALLGLELPPVVS